MIRKTFYIEEKDLEYLKSLGETVTDHIRRALAGYIRKMKMKHITISPSKHGRWRLESQKHT